VTRTKLSALLAGAVCLVAALIQPVSSHADTAIAAQAVAASGISDGTCGGVGGACWVPYTPSPAQTRMEALKRSIQAQIAAGEVPNDPTTVQSLMGIGPAPQNGLAADNTSASPNIVGGGGWYYASTGQYREADAGLGGSCYGSSNGYCR